MMMMMMMLMMMMMMMIVLERIDEDCSISFVSLTAYIKPQHLMSSLFEEHNGFAHAAGRPAHATGTRHPQHGRHPTKPRIMMRLLARLGVRNPQGHLIIQGKA